MLLSFKILDSPGTKKDARHRKKTWEKNIVKKSGRASSSFDSAPRRGECWKEGKESCKPECWRPRQAEGTEGVAQPRPSSSSRVWRHGSSGGGCCPTTLLSSSWLLQGGGLASYQTLPCSSRKAKLRMFMWKLSSKIFFNKIK